MEGPSIIYEVGIASTARARGIDPLGSSLFEKALIVTNRAYDGINHSGHFGGHRGKAFRFRSASNGVVAR